MTRGSGRVRPKLTGDDLVAIEVRARTVTKGLANRQQQMAIAFQVCMQDVPDLLVEIRRLRAESRAARDPGRPRGEEGGEGQ